MPEPRPWPNNASEARDRAAEEAARGVRILTPLVMEDGHTQEELERGAAKSLNLFQSILRWLESVGAKTRP